MALFVEFGKAGTGSISGKDLDVEVANAASSEEVLTGAASVGSAADDTSVVTLTATASGYALFTTAGTVPTAKQDGSRRILAGIPRSFALRAGLKVGWLEA